MAEPLGQQQPDQSDVEAKAQGLENLALAYDADKPEIAADLRNRAAALRGDRRAQLRAEHKGRRILAGWDARAERGREYRDRSVAWLRAVVTAAVRPRERRDAAGRSSQRSGDSPDDGPSDSDADPPLTRPCRASRRTRAPPARRLL